jgi:hypothetical protein
MGKDFFDCHGRLIYLEDWVAFITNGGLIDKGEVEDLYLEEGVPTVLISFDGNEDTFERRPCCETATFPRKGP